MCRFHNTAQSVVVENAHRLPRAVLPDSYEIRLEPDLKAASFSGEVSIRVRVSEPVSEIVLNAHELAISEAIVRKGNGTLFIGDVHLDAENQRAHIKVNGTIGRGEWTVKMRFTGVLNDKLKGFYRSVYTDTNGQEQVIATTQFESTDARRAFPCFDEPDMKATFKITLVVDKDLAAVSNGRVVSTTYLDSGKKVVEFAPTMKMSTYIVAFVVGKLVSTKPIEVDGVQVQMWCEPGKLHLTKFALEAAQFSLRYFRKYFGVPYPSDKLDLLAIPDFAAGAMENMGCVTFRDVVLVDPETAAQSSLDWVAEVVAHENAHMWFGNLVTMKWWNGLWLNEAFATFMSYKAVEAFKAEWKVWDKFGLSRGAAMRTDGLKSTRPVEYVVSHPDEAEGMFDVLTYEKGCSVMRMLEQYLGEETFRRGIAAYIKAHSYGNTETADLWAALEASSGLPVGKIMDGWIFKSGYPVIQVKRAEAAGCVTLTQQSFKFLAEAVDPQRLWSVPVMLRYKTVDGVGETKLLLESKEQTVYLGEGLEWVVVNAGGHGFYRTLYSDELASKLTTDVLDKLSVIERSNLISDSWACVRAGMSDSLSFLALVKLMDEEVDPNVWTTILGPLGAMRDMLPKTHRPQFEAVVRTIVGPTMQRLGWTPREGETSQISELRASIISAMGNAGNDASVRQQARQLYDAWKADPDTLDGNVRSTVISLAALDGDQDLYDEFYLSFKRTDQTPEVRENFLYALARFQDLALLERTLQAALKKDIRTQDGPSIIAGIMQNEVASETAWKFVKDNWDILAQIFPVSGMVRICSGVTALATPQLEAEVNAWFQTHKVKGGDKAIPQYLELLRIGVLMREREAPKLVTEFAPKPEPTPAEPAGCQPAQAQDEDDEPANDDPAVQLWEDEGGNCGKKQRPSSSTVTPSAPSGGDTK